MAILLLLLVPQRHMHGPLPAIIFGQMRFLILGLIFITCSSELRTEVPDIDGDWIFIDNPEEITINYSGLRFDGDTLYTINDSGITQEGKFLVSGDTIIVWEFGEKINKERRIKKLTKDSLVLTGSTFDEKYYSRKLEFTENLVFNDLRLVSDGCLGNCPEFIVRLSDSGLIQFKPIMYCKVTRVREFTLDTKKKNTIDSLFKWSYIQKLDTTKDYGVVDDWGFDIEVIYNDGQTIKFTTSSSKFPFRLKKIFGLLIDELHETGCI